ncbi:mobilization protein, partial [Streptococcus orisratti]
GAGIYGSFRLMYEASTTWLDKRPKIFKRIFPKK